MAMPVDTDTSVTARQEALNLASQIVAAYVRNNPVPVGDLPNVIRNVHGTLCGLGGTRAGDLVTGQKPAVPVRKSVTADYIVSLEDGARLKMLKRYLRSRYDMSPEQYRVKWGLPRDYPMVAPNYSAKRSELAKRIGLGRTRSPAAPRRRKRR
jgi:predicted transcriptional regulator